MCCSCGRPILLIAVAVPALADRLGRWNGRVVAAVAMVLCTANLLVLNTHFVNLIRNGSSVRWTDAFPALIETLRKSPAQRVFVPDWGYWRRSTC